MADKRLFTVDDLQPKIPSELAVGPGPGVVYTLRDADLEESSYRAHLWLAEPGQEPVQLTRSARGCTAAQWAPDGPYLAFISSRPDPRGGDHSGKSQVYLLPAAGGEAFCLTRAPQGIREFQWAPGGASLCFIADEPEGDASLCFSADEPEGDAETTRKDRERRQRFDAIVEHGERRRRQIWQVPAKPGAEAKLRFDGDFGVSAIAIAPDGEEVAYTTNYTAGGRITVNRTCAS